MLVMQSQSSDLKEPVLARAAFELLAARLSCSSAVPFFCLQRCKAAACQAAAKKGQAAKPLAPKKKEKKAI